LLNQCSFFIRAETTFSTSNFFSLTMKPKLILALALFIAHNSFAQDLQSVQKLMASNSWWKAKGQIDSLILVNKTDPAPWFYKGKIYTELARHAMENASMDLIAPAFDAYKNYQQKSPDNKLMTLDNNIGLFQLYDLCYLRGRKAYSEELYDTAFLFNKKALEIRDYIARKNLTINGFTFSALDTQLVYLAGSSAYFARREDESIPYFEKLADAKLTDTVYKDVYSMLANYYIRKNDSAKYSKYLSLGKKLFPDDEYWIGVEFGQPGTDPVQRFNRYEQLLTKYPVAYRLNMDYAIELFNYIYGDKQPADYLAKQEKLNAVLLRTVKLNSTALANFVMSQHIYNQIYDLKNAQREIAGTTAADLAKKKDLLSKIDSKFELLLLYAQNAYDLYAAQPELTAQERQNFRKVVEVLIGYYQAKNMGDKIAFYEKKLASIK
jgi:hypothetical protein